MFKIYFETVQDEKKINCNFQMENIGALVIKQLLRDSLIFQFSDEYNECDILFFALSDFTNFLPYYNLWKTIPGKENKLIIVGGNATNYCATIENFFDIACIGEGFDFIYKLIDICKNVKKFNKTKILTEIAKIIDSAYIPSIHKRIYNETNKKYSHIELQQKINRSTYIDWNSLRSYEVAHSTYYTLVSKGCKHRCYFCQTGWIRRYEEEPDSDKIAYYAKLYKDKYGKVYWVTNDLMMTSYYPVLSISSAISLSLEYYNRNMKSNEKAFYAKQSLNNAKMIRFGIDGISEQIRKAINKKISNDDLVSILDKYHYLFQKKYFQLFYIFGYSIESSEDYDEFYRCLYRTRQHLTDMHVIFKFTHICPQAFTPLQFHDWKIRKNINYEKIKYMLLQLDAAVYGSGNPKNILLNTILCNGNGLMGQLILENYNKINTIQDIHTLFESHSIYDIDNGYSIYDELPNDFVAYDREKLIRCYIKYSTTKK